MDAALWLGLGLIAGGIVSLFYDDSLLATARNIVFGAVGSIVGGGLITTWDHGRLPTLDFYFYSIIFTFMVSLAMISAIRARVVIMRQDFTPLKKELIDEESDTLITT